MEIKRPIFWQQGLFLQPQHLQLADLHQGFLHKPLYEHGLPHFWGVSGLQIAESALANRSFELLAGTLLFPDGTFVELPGNALVRARSFDGAWVEGDRPFTVHVGIKKLHQSERNVTVLRSFDDLAGVNSRFVTRVDPEAVNDLYSDGPAAQVKSLTCLLQVFWEHELAELDGYVTMPVARLERDGETIRLSEHFIAPCYCLSGSAPLLKVVRDIRDEVAGRTRQLEEYKSPREIQKSEFDASYMVYLLALRSLNRYVPVLFHYAEARQLHPWVVYGTLRQLVGELSSFSDRVGMLGESADGDPPLPAYDHGDLAKCMTAAHTLITRLLNEITIGPELLVHLDPEGDLFVADLPRKFFGPRNRFYLVMRTEADAETTLRAFDAEAKLAARAQLPVLVSRALPGVELIHMPVAPQGLPRRSYSFYFRIEPVSEQWEFVEKEANVALYWADAPEDLKVELVVLRR